MSRASNLAGFTTSISPPANLSVGIITASSVINVGTGLTLSSSGINITGVITATSFSGNGSGLIGVGLGTTGSVNTSGIITASSFSGNGSGLTGVAATTLTIGAGTTAAPSISPTGDSNTGIFFPSADTIAFGEGGAEALRVDSSGRLLVGTSTVPTIVGVPANTLVVSSASNDGSWTGTFQGTGASTNRGVLVTYPNSSPNNLDNQAFYFADSGGSRFQVRSNGGIANYQANDVNLSDRNVKKDISLSVDTWDCVKKWEIVNYRYKDQPDDADLNLGVIAQQVAESCPEVVTIFEPAKESKLAVLDEEGNEVNPAQEAQPEKLGVKEQQMYWMAIKALQEAQVRIEQLESAVATLQQS